MSQWSNVDDFVIPDEETVSSPPPPNASKPSELSGSLFSSPWPGNVDLSARFTPFTSQAFADTTIREHQYTGGDTLDEPVLLTLSRDLLRIWKRLTFVIWPSQLSTLASVHQNHLIDFAINNGINLPDLITSRRVSVAYDESNLENADFHTLDWDLWGPLIFSLFYSVVLGISAPTEQTNSVFSGSFAFIWAFYFVVGLNIQLLGGNISFMSAISAVGYSIFPITLGELVCSLFVGFKLIRFIIMCVLCLWSIYSGVLSLKCSGVLPGRVLLAIYPVILMYSILSWLVVIT